jgi:hypothetical protein
VANTVPSLIVKVFLFLFFFISSYFIDPLSCVQGRRILRNRSLLELCLHLQGAEGNCACPDSPGPQCRRTLELGAQSRSRFL